LFMMVGGTAQTNLIISKMRQGNEFCLLHSPKNNAP
jgi:hypothetical protein